MTVHNYRSRQVHETLNGVNPSSGFRDMRSAKSGPNLYQIWQVFGPWASPFGANGKMTMTVHNYRPRQFYRTSNGENPSSGYRDMGSASLAAARPAARPPGPWRQYPSSPEGWGVKRIHLMQSIDTSLLSSTLSFHWNSLELSLLQFLSYLETDCYSHYFSTICAINRALQTWPMSDDSIIFSSRGEYIAPTPWCNVPQFNNIESPPWSTNQLNRSHYNDLEWLVCHLKSLTTWLFVIQLVQTNNKEDIKAPYNWPFVRESITIGGSDHKGSVLQKVFLCHDFIM